MFKEKHTLFSPVIMAKKFESELEFWSAIMSIASFKTVPTQKLCPVETMMPREKKKSHSKLYVST